MNIKKLGRIENCCGTCSILDSSNVKNREDFSRVFDYTGTPIYTHVAGADPQLNSIDSSREDTITFNTYCTLTLKEPSAIFANDNYALCLSPKTTFTVGEYSTQTEEFKFTIGNHTILRKHEYYGTATQSDSHYCSSSIITVKFDGVEVFNNCGTSFYPSDGGFNIFENYLIRRDSWLYYYIGNVYIGRFYDDITQPVNFNYAWHGDNNCNIVFDEWSIQSWYGGAGSYYCQAIPIVHVWKPDKWLNTYPWQKYKKPPKQTDNNLTSTITDVYEKYNSDKFEHEGCVSPAYTNGGGGAERIGIIDLRTYKGKGSDVVNSSLIDTVTFQKLSPAIGINIHGFTPYNSTVPASLSSGSCSYWNYDGETNSFGNIYHDITVSDVPGLSEAIANGTTNINSIMESYANTLTSQGYGYQLSWTNGSTVQIDYSNIENVILPAVEGGTGITFQDLPPITYLTNNTATYPDTTDNYGNSIGHYYNEIYRSKVFNWDTMQYEWRVNRYISSSFGLSRTNPFDQNDVDICDQTGITNATLMIANGIVAPPLSCKIGYNHTFEISIPEGYQGFKPSIIENYTSTYPQVKDVEITDQPGEGNVTIEKTSFPYKITYQSPTLPQYKYTTFEYTITDDYGAKSSAVVTVFFDDTEGDDYVTLSQDNSNTFGMPDYRLDYDVIVRVRFTLKGVGTTNLYYIHDGNLVSLAELYGESATYITELDSEDGNGNPIRQMYTMDGQSHTNVVADFYQVSTPNGCQNHQLNFAFADDYDNNRKPYNVAYVEATIDCYYHQYNNGSYEWVDRERKTCVLNPYHTLDCHCVSRMSSNTPYLFSGSFSYTHAEDGADHTSTETIQINPDYNYTFPDCLHGFSHDIVIMPGGYNQKIGYQIISFTVHYENDAKQPVTINDWVHS